MNTDNAHLTSEMAYWITERYSVKLRKDQGLSKPWSPDTIFQTTRFCNVHREDDKVTKWIRENWNKAGDKASKFLLGRLLNLPETLQSILDYAGDELDWEGLRDGLHAIQATGVKIFTSAYTVSTIGKKISKIDYVVNLCQDVDQWFHEEYPSCQDAFDELKLHEGLGSFLSAQVIADMKNTPGHPLVVAKDWWVFSAPGPGSLRGLGWYFGGQGAGVTAATYQTALKVCMDEVLPLVPTYVPRISNQDFQNCLCEMSKYMNVKVFNGHVRNRYQGKA